MSGIIDAARSSWNSRSQREQGLLVIMIILLSAVLLWFGVARPAMAWRAAATERRAEAGANLALINAGKARIVGTPSGMAAAEVLAMARRAADTGGVNVTFNPLNDGVGFSANGATTAVLFGWLGTLHTEHGIEVRTLTVNENADATLNAEGLLLGPPALQSVAR